jgi:hypothetical protein
MTMMAMPVKNKERANVRGGCRKRGTQSQMFVKEDAESKLMQQQRQH